MTRAESNPRRGVSDLAVATAARGILPICRRRRRDPVNIASSSAADAVVFVVLVESRLRSRGPLNSGNLELLYPVNPCIYFSFREGDSFRVVGFTIAYLHTKDRTM